MTTILLPEELLAPEAFEAFCQRSMMPTMTFRKAAQEPFEVRMLPELADMLAHGAHLTLEGPRDVDHVVSVIAHGRCRSSCVASPPRLLEDGAAPDRL